MNAFTGGCHYDNDCGRFAQSCGACPQLGSGSPGDLSRMIWQRKSRIFSALKPEQLHIVSQSQWLARATSNSSLLGRFPVSVIPNAVDTDVFRPRDRNACRAALGIPLDARVLLFVAGSLLNRRKGFHMLAKAFEECSELRGLDKLFLLSVGKGNAGGQWDLPHLHLGHVSNDHFLSIAYNAADLFVIPALQDNLPNTVLEAMACGVAVAGFSVGGIPDMVVDGETGILMPHVDSASLAEGVLSLLGSPHKTAEFGVAARKRVMVSFTRELCARRFVRLYEDLVVSAGRRAQRR